MHSNMHISLSAPQETPPTHSSPLSSEKCHSFPITVLTLCHPALEQLNRAIRWLSNKKTQLWNLPREGSSWGINRQASCAAAPEATAFTQCSFHFHTSGNSTRTAASQLCCRFPTLTRMHASNPDSVPTACTSPIPKYSFPSLLRQGSIAIQLLSACTHITDLRSSLSHT